MQEDIVSGLWAFVTIGGPILLAIALAYGVSKTKPWQRWSGRGPIPPRGRTVNAADWGAEDRLGQRR